MKIINSRTSGFTLVELIVVVAIIGLLSTLGGPLYENFAYQAQKVEAKLQMSGLFTAEKAFYAEYTAYHTNFIAVGYSPAGKIRYNVGFSGGSAFDAGPSNGYNTIHTLAYQNTFYYCKSAYGGAGGAPGSQCQMMVGPGDALMMIGSGFTVRTNGFLIGAASSVYPRVVGMKDTSPTYMQSLFRFQKRVWAGGPPLPTGTFKYVNLAMDQNKNVQTIVCTATYPISGPGANITNLIVVGANDKLSCGVY